MPSGLPRVAVTMGDPCGVGPEVTVVALADPRVRAALTPLVYGDPGALQAACERLGLAANARAEELPAAAFAALFRLLRPALRPGRD